MEQEYIIYIILAFLLGFLLKSLLNNKFCNNKKIFTEPFSSSWSCGNNIFAPVRINDKGDVECMATNGRDCLWTADLNTCNNTIGQNNDSTKLNPLACGDMHKSIYGDTGYDSSNHWCAKTKAALVPPVTPQTAPLSTLQSQWNTIGCKSNLTENDVAWWRTKDNDTVKNDMSTYYSLASTCTGTQGQNDFCLPNSCKPPPVTPPPVTPQTAPLSTLQSQWNTIGCKSNLTENDVAWWRTKDNDTVKNDMSTYYSLASTCTGTQGQNDFCLPNTCKPPPIILPTPEETAEETAESSSEIDTTPAPPLTDTTPIDFKSFSKKIMGKSKNGKTIKRYNNIQKCVKDCASNTKCVGIVINQSGFKKTGSICKTIKDFSKPHNNPNAIAYLKK